MKLHNSEITSDFKISYTTTESSTTLIKYLFCFFHLQEQRKQLEKEEKGPLKITFVDDDSVEEMVDLTGLYKYINSQSLMMVSHFLNYKSIGNP